jgi:dolichol-phosphate mannosyltransferase
MQAYKKISFVIPSYNEASNIEKLYKEILQVTSSLPYAFEFLFVDDGSLDNTLAVIKSLSAVDARVFYIELSRNFGHQAALKAGIDIAKGDCVITMDGDLQHPPAILKDMIKGWEDGNDIVYTVRKENKNLSWFKRKSSSLYYTLHNQLSDLKLEKGTADFRLMSRSVVEAFSNFSEHELFIRGLIKWSGFQQKAIEYDSNERYSGVTKYSLYKMISLALKGITSFSVKPLKLIAYVGVIFFCISLVIVPYVFVSYFLGATVAGWTSIITTVFFFGSLQLLMLGIISIYLGKLVIQSKNRPLYFIRNTNYSNKQ